VCAYCGVEYPPRTLTLDHVTPRRGQSAYGRCDNLVLACTRCNAAKADKSFLAWVLGARARAVNQDRQDRGVAVQERNA
jgi:5-methylcytosine-specific restriction endonuclease McrA